MFYSVFARELLLIHRNDPKLLLDVNRTVLKLAHVNMVAYHDSQTFMKAQFRAQRTQELSCGLESKQWEYLHDEKEEEAAAAI